MRDPLDLAAFAVACAGATFGFLWWNTSPAQIFMGDTGSLALGGAMAALAIMTRTELLFVLLGGLFVIITLSVIAQVGSFKLTGKRVLRMAPLHHHFEMLGWHEITIVVRFWLIQGLCVAAGLALFYAEWVRLMVDHLVRDSDWSGVHVAVAGIGIAGFAAADALLSLGARVTAVDAGDGPRQQERAQILDVLGATVRLGDGDTLPDGVDLLVVSPGLSPLSPIIAAAQEAGVPVWGELELAWRLRPAQGGRPLAGRHRHQRQDHDHPDARVDAACRRPADRRRRATSGSRWSTW